MNPVVRPGQIWRDNDKRYFKVGGKHRFIRILKAIGHDGTRGVRFRCETVRKSDDGSWVCDGRFQTTISEHRFKPIANGYVLFEDAAMENSAS